MVQTPIVNAGLKYVNGLELTVASQTTLGLAAGAARNSTNVNDITLNAAVVINGAVVGANGVDVAVIVLSATYAVYVIGDSTGFQPTAGLLSLAANATPSLPEGYDMYRRVGWAITDASVHFLQFWQNGHGATRDYLWDVNIATAVTAGNATSLTAVSMAPGVPPVACNVLLQCAFTANATSSRAEFGPFGQVNAVGPIKMGTGAAGAVAQDWVVPVPCRLDTGVPKIVYLVSSGSDAIAINIAGFQDLLA